MVISIVIPTLNEENYIGTLLTFLSSHPHKDQFKVIVVDGGSTDATVELVKEFKYRVTCTKKASRAHQMNVGARLAQGDVLYFVHADTQLIPSFVDDIEKAIQAGANCGCYRFKFYKSKNPLLHINGYFTRFPFKWCRGGDQTLFIKKDLFESLGGFDEHFVIMEDYELLDRLERQNVPFMVLPKSVKVSARKYERNSYLKVQLANLKAMRMYRNGVSPVEIKNYYHATLNG